MSKIVREIISHCGVIGSGKTYRSEQYVANGGFIRLGFAAELKEDLTELLGYRFYEQDTKNIKIGAFTGRQIMQNYGSLLRHHNGSDYWVERFKRVAMRDLCNTNIVVDDLRYPSEVLGIVNMCYLFQELHPNYEVKFRFIFCDYKSDRYDAESHHESEALAQRLKKEGYVDGAELTLADLL